MSKRILLMYISNNSGHHRACMAVENALYLLDKNIETKNINAFHYTSPLLEKIINKTYMTVIKNKPEIWEYLYDNPIIVKKTQKLKKTIHKLNSKKMKELIDNFKPDVVVCTQAFPCGMVADLKKTYNLDIRLIAILTDYAPHSYWVYSTVNLYVVPSEEIGQKFTMNNIPKNRIKALGIPVDPKFYKELDKNTIFNKYSLNSHQPVILVMGGGQGLGPIKKIAHQLDNLDLDIQIIIVTGTNKKLYNTLRKCTFRKKVIVLPFSEYINELMEISTIIVTKPGGLTTAEALSKTLPIIIANPLPGQELMNTRFLLDKGLAVKAEDGNGVSILVKDFLKNPDKLETIKENIRKYSKPETSLRIAELILEEC